MLDDLYYHLRMLRGTGTDVGTEIIHGKKATHFPFAGWQRDVGWFLTGVRRSHHLVSRSYKHGAFYHA